MAEPKLHENAKQILRVISRIEGEVGTDKITSQSGIKNDLVNYHIGTLKDRGLVEKVGTDDSVNAPIPANTYDVTSAGERKAEEIRAEVNSQPDVGGDEAERIAELEETVDLLKRQRDTILDRLDKIEPLVEENKKIIDQATSRSR